MPVSPSLFGDTDMKTLLRPLLITLASCLAATAFAQPPLQRSPAEMMKQADTDNDGKLSRDEFIKARTANLEEAFDKLDTDSSGALDQQELRAAADRLSPSPVGGREDTGGRRRPAQRPQPPTGERPRAGAMAAAAFDRLDGDGAGRLSREEFEAGMARLRELMERRGGPEGRSLGRPAPAGRGSD